MDIIKPVSLQSTILHTETKSTSAIRRTMSTVVQAPLTQGAGYGVVVGLGVAFALGKFARTAAL